MFICTRCANREAISGEIWRPTLRQLQQITKAQEAWKRRAEQEDADQ